MTNQSRTSVAIVLAVRVAVIALALVLAPIFAINGAGDACRWERHCWASKGDRMTAR
jgi:hypothetical protein